MSEAPHDPDKLLEELEEVYETDYELGQDNITWLGLDLHNPVFVVSVVLIILFVILSLIFPEQANSMLGSTREWIGETFDWLFLSAANFFVLFCLALIVLPVGSIRLGGEDAKPDFSMLSWFAMLFAAGMGIGLMFWSVAEPVGYFTEWFGTPLNIEGGTEASKTAALGATMYHWGLHPWAIYGVVALSLAFFSYNKGLPLTIRSTFYPLLGDRVWGWMGDVIDTLAVLATIFGLATSLGLGAQQAAGGMDFLFGIPSGLASQIAIIGGVTAIALISVLRGIHGGVKILSNLNMFLAGLLLLFVVFAGNVMSFLGNLGQTALGYFQYMLPLSNPVGREDDVFYHSWTIFFWAWWIAWSPFVGMFIARISRGRTIREFILGVLFVPSALAAIWMTGFGSTALHQITRGLRVGDAEVANVNGTDYPVQVIDEESGLPRQQNGDWLVGPHAKNVATPRGILMQMSDQQLVTKSGASVEYLRGVLVERDTVRPYRPTDEERFDGTFESRIETLDLAGFLTRPVLSPDRTRRVDTTSTAMFVMLSAYPLATLTTLLGTLTIILFFITSSDSASLVADIIASGGNQNPTTGTRLFWGILEGLLASSLLLAGGLKGLQTGAITIGLPFCLLVILMCFSLYRGLRDEAELATELAATDTADEASQA